MRITKDQLETRVAMINEFAGVPVSAKYGDEGFYCLDWAYGQPSLVRCTKSGEEIILHRGVTRDLFDRLCAYLDGMRAGRESAQLLLALMKEKGI